MKTTIGGDRLGSGNKQNVSLKNYSRSSHDLSEAWRSSMSAGTLVPFLSKVALPGDSFDIDLFCEVLTLPTIGPLFGSFKVQLDMFQIPIRLYNAALHMNKLGIGMDMSSVYLPRLTVQAFTPSEQGEDLGDNDQISSSCILKYLGISGIGNINQSSTPTAYRDFNGVTFLGYWDVYKNYYSNKQEERGFVIHTESGTILNRQLITDAVLWVDDVEIGTIFETTEQSTAGEVKRKVVVQFVEDAQEPNPDSLVILVGGSPISFSSYFHVDNIIGAGVTWDNELKQLTGENTVNRTDVTLEIEEQSVIPLFPYTDTSPELAEFPLSNIDLMREKVLQHNPTNTPFYIREAALSETEPMMPYIGINDLVDVTDLTAYSIKFSQEGLGIKTYQSDLFNNWINTEWIDGTNGINEITSVDTTGDSFTIDALNLAQKVYVMLNRIAISGGSYDDWLDAVYTHERTKSIESPMYLGSLIKELAFEEVISTAETAGEGNEQPLGTLAGRGRLTDKNKGGKIRAKIDEPSYIMGIVSLTPRIDYSQGNSWDVNLNTMNDFHKPALDAIGFQELITEQMAWQSTDLLSVPDGPTYSNTLTTRSAGKQPAWINYMTSINKTFGHFADENKDMFMTLNRRYEIDPTDGTISDLTTYIDPTKYNHIFAQTSLDAQNFWVQIGSKVIARRKMSAKVIPNL